MRSLTYVVSTADVMTVAPGTAREAHGLHALSPTSSVCGPAATCRCRPGDNLALHRLLAGAAPQSVLVCDGRGHLQSGYFGELMARDALNRSLCGLVVDGAIRDSAALRELGFPVFHRGLAPTPCVKSEVGSVGEQVELAGVPVAPGDRIVADADGVVVVARADWPEVERAVAALRAGEAEIRAALDKGERLADLLRLPEGDQV